MRTSFSYLLPAFVVMGALALSGCASSQTGDQLAGGKSDPSCQSKWVASGNNGAKADRYYPSNCE